MGVRVAGRMAGERLMASAQNAPAASAPRGRTAGQATGSVSKGLARGVKGFLRPFTRVGGILWLEVTGVFFFAFVLVFSQTLWRTRASAEHGPDHAKFVVAGCLMAVFLYLAISSFWRARRR